MVCKLAEKSYFYMELDNLKDKNYNFNICLQGFLTFQARKRRNTININSQHG